MQKQRIVVHFDVPAENVQSAMQRIFDTFMDSDIEPTFAESETIVNEFDDDEVEPDLSGNWMKAILGGDAADDEDE